MTNKETDEIINRTKIRNILRVICKRHLFHWPFFVAIIFTLFSVFTLHWSKPHVENLYPIIDKHLDTIISLSISSLSIVIAAFAIIFIIYSRNNLRLFMDVPDGIEGFVSPYIWAAIVWCTLSCISFYSLIYKNNLLYLSMVFLFYYGSLLMIYLLLEILQHLMLSLKHNNG